MHIKCIRKQLLFVRFMINLFEEIFRVKIFFISEFISNRDITGYYHVPMLSIKLDLKDF